MRTRLTIELPSDGVPARVLEGIDTILSLHYAKHPAMQYGAARRVWTVDIEPIPQPKDDQEGWE
jgi:hypothetical protein